MMTNVEFSKVLAKSLQGLKKQIGATQVNQGYKGTGKQSFRRQVFVRLSNGQLVDLWIEANTLVVGGVILTNYKKISIEDQNVTRIMDELCSSLNTLL